MCKQCPPQLSFEDAMEIGSFDQPERHQMKGTEQILLDLQNLTPETAKNIDFRKLLLEFMHQHNQENKNERRKRKTSTQECRP